LARFFADLMLATRESWECWVELTLGGDVGQVLTPVDRKVWGIQ
jgi:hypothetical protein